MWAMHHQRPRWRPRAGTHTRGSAPWQAPPLGAPARARTPSHGWWLVEWKRWHGCTSRLQHQRGGTSRLAQRWVRARLQFRSLMSSSTSRIAAVWLRPRATCRVRGEAVEVICPRHTALRSCPAPSPPPTSTLAPPCPNTHTRPRGPVAHLQRLPRLEERHAQVIVARGARVHPLHERGRPAVAVVALAQLACGHEHERAGRARRWRHRPRAGGWALARARW